MQDKVTAPAIRAMKAANRKIVCLTAYDAYFGAVADRAGVDLILVGDSLANVVLGFETTLPVNLDEMAHHTRAVARGAKRALIVADLPFGSYNASVEQAVESAVVLMKAGAQAVKLEGDYHEAIAAIVKAGIPVMGHVGMTPQSVHNFGGFRVQGRGEDGDTILQAARAIENAGAFGIVLELIPAALSAQISAAISIPTIGIGAGPNCDGQVQVLHDILGFAERTFKHAKRYLDGENLVSVAIREYAEETRSRAFPTPEQSF